MSDWKPTASIETLKTRAELLVQIRQFFAERDILEVETPLLSHHGVTDRYMKSFQVDGFAGGVGFLQTSPEYAMKRLLAAGSGSIFQICKSFRQDELGQRHNPEFTMLEWYCEGFDHHQLMEQVFELLEALAQTQGFSVALNKRNYTEVFTHYLNINPLSISDSELVELAGNLLGDLPSELERDDYLVLLFEDRIEPLLGQNGDIDCIYDYPASQAALARLNPDNPEVACRFEVYWQGVELANGFYELSDAAEQRRRFEADNQWRVSQGLPRMTIDQHLIAALERGLPDCSGVALGVDRLLMILLQANTLQDVIAFSADRA
ncbi:EF-P lysine aminoacylase EpmA [Kangiella shandongensis]|uniref:EF-P lysine aminoacylase EpmA n=1 Tax=Kangiella shandongensis TaxID=2763258 RepID=UPI001CBBA2C4|nr:EF-P lysine aminoacylase EpmA [Kangiella shandongensis]